MIVVNPDLATNTIKFLPRNYDISALDNTKIDLYLTNEETRVVYNDNSTYLTNVYQSNDYYNIDLTFDFSENDVYSVKILDNSDDSVIFRGKLFATSQDTQKYKING